jgi:hypothetical protein
MKIFLFSKRTRLFVVTFYNAGVVTQDRRIGSRCESIVYLIKKTLVHILVQYCKSQTHGCQMVYFRTKNLNLGKVCRVLQWKMLAYFMAVCSILGPFGIFVSIWYIFHVLVYCTKKNLATLVKLHIRNVVESFLRAYFFHPKRAISSPCAQEGFYGKNLKCL